MDDYQHCILAAASELAVARRPIHAKISNYPTPIAGCDAQFNHLLAERQKVISAINSPKKLCLCQRRVRQPNIRGLNAVESPRSRMSG